MELVGKYRNRDRAISMISVDVPIEKSMRQKTRSYDKRPMTAFCRTFNVI